MGSEREDHREQLGYMGRRLGAGVGIMLVVIAIVVVFELRRERSHRWKMPSVPEKHRMTGCGCPLPEGGRLDVEGELKEITVSRRTFVWGLTDGTKPVPFGDNSSDRIWNTAVPTNVTTNDGFELFIGCDGPRILVASFDQISAFELQGGLHLWTRRLPKNIPRGMSVLYGDPAIACSTLEVKDGVVEVATGQTTLRYKTASGEYAKQ